MFVSEVLSLPIFLIRKYKDPEDFEKRAEEAEKNGKKLNMNKFILYY